MDALNLTFKRRDLDLDLDFDRFNLWLVWVVYKLSVVSWQLKQEKLEYLMKN